MTKELTFDFAPNLKQQKNNKYTFLLKEPPKF